MLTFYWTPPIKGASPQRLKISNAKGAIVQPDAILVNGGWKYIVDDCIENRRWMETVSPNSGWSLEPPITDESISISEPEREQEELKETLSPPPQRPRARSARRLNQTRVIE